MTTENERSARVDASELSDGQNILSALAAIELELDAVRGPVLEKLRQLLVNHEGDRFNSIETTREIGRRIQWIITQLGMTAKCPKTNGLATFRGKTNGRTVGGAFEFRRTVDGKMSGTLTSVSLPHIPMTSHPKSISNLQNPKLCAA